MLSARTLAVASIGIIALLGGWRILNAYADFSAVSYPITINEFVSYPSSPGSEWVELYNGSNASVDISGWKIQNLTFSGSTPDGTATTTIPASITIPPHGFYVQNVTGLNNKGDTISLYGTSTPAALVDSVTYGVVAGSTSVITAPPQGESAGREPDGSNHWQIFSAPTPDASNNLPVEDVTQGTYFSTIQAAVDAASSGDTIQVATGTFDGFSVDGKTNLTIQGAGAAETIVAPSALIDTGIPDKFDVDMHSSVFVNDSTDITIQGMTIESTNATPVSSAAVGSGVNNAIVFWNASSGTIADSNITGTYTISGAQTGQGIAIDATTGSHALAVNNVNISGFQKNGIQAIDGNGATSGASDTISLSVTGGSITGAGKTAVIAQNGILVWNRGGGTVTGSVSGTTIKDLEYTPSPVDAGVMAYGSASISSVSNTTFQNSDLYIWNGGTTATDATNGNTFDGVSPASATPTQLAVIENKIGDTISSAAVGGAGPIFILPHTWIATTANQGIQAALNAAASGDTVLVTPGAYTENLTINQPVSLKGPNAGINPNTGTRGPEAALTGQVQEFASDVTVDGLSFTDPSYSGPTIKAIQVYSAGPAISNIAIKNNIFANIADSEAHGSYGLMVQGDVSGVNVSDNAFNNITSAGWAHAMEVTPTCNSASVPQNVTINGNKVGTITGANGDSYAFSADWCDANNITDASQIALHGNQFTGAGIRNLDTKHVLDATNNWWGSATGPNDPTSNDGSIPDTNAGSGTVAQGAVHYADWCNNAACTETVTVDAFINGVAASTSPATAVFPMKSSWTGAPATGSGSYTLSPKGYNSPIAYEAITSPMSFGASYSTQELTSSPVVASDCSTGKPYMLEGYTTGSTFAAAAAATPSLVTPSLANLTTNGNVIVWNEACVPSVTTNAATDVTFSDAMLGGTNGLLAADQESFWVSTSTIDLSSSNIPAGVYSTPVLSGVGANVSFSDPLSVVTTNGITTGGVHANMPAIMPSTTYYYVAWSHVGGKWYHGQQQSFTTASAPKVTTDAATSISASTAKLNGTNGPSVADNTSFWWGTTPIGSLVGSSNPVTEFPHTGWTHDSGLGRVVASGPFDETLSGLSPNTTYYFVAWSYVGGVWYPGVVEQFTTAPLVTEFVTTDTPTGVSATDATLNGTIGAANADGHSFWVSRNAFSTSSPEIPSGVYSTSDFGSIASGTHFSALLSSLVTNAVLSGGVLGAMPSIVAGMTYHVVAWAHVNGVWHAGTEDTFTTGLAAPVITSPVNDSATTTAGLTQVSWTAVPGTGVTYLYQSSLSDAMTSTGAFANPIYTAGSLTAAHIVTAGTQAGIYYIHVMAKDAQGNESAWSPVVKVTVYTVLPTVYSYSYATTTVQAADLAVGSADVVAHPTDWFFWDDTSNNIDDSLGSFVSGPATAPLGNGSAQISVAAGHRTALETVGLAGIPLKEITSLSYSTYRSVGTSDLALSLQFDVNTNGTGTPTPYQGRLVYEPYYTNTVKDNTWQTWNTLTSGADWYFSDAGSKVTTTCAQGSPCTWAQILADFPNIGISGGTYFKAGQWIGSDFTGNVDDFVVAVKSGTDIAQVTYDFEPTTPVLVSATTGTGGGANGILGDLNGDGQVNFLDFALMMAAFGAHGKGLKADLNGDGIVNAADLAILLGNWTGS